MRPAEEINKLIKKLQLKASADLDKRVSESISSAQVKQKNKQATYMSQNIWSNIMKNPITKFAAAAIIIIAVLIGINPFKPSITIAQVVEPILNARTIIFDLLSGTDETGMVIHEIVVGSRIRRTMSNMPNMTMIIDMDNEKLLALDTVGKTAFYADIKGELGDMTRSYIVFVRQIIRQFQDDQVEKLGEQIIDGHKAIGFKGRGHTDEVIIWADSQTAIPIQIEVNSKQGLAFSMKNFVFDAKVEESLVSMDIPNGYTQKQNNVNLGNATEEDFIESLRIWAEVIRDGSFPEAIGTQNTMEQMPVLVEKIGQMKIPEEKATQMGVAFGKGMLFHQIIGTQGDEWKYVGAGIKLGETNKAIFWYQPKGSSTYRVIYGDLHVEDVALENLPK